MKAAFTELVRVSTNLTDQGCGGLWWGMNQVACTHVNIAAEFW